MNKWTELDTLLWELSRDLIILNERVEKIMKRIGYQLYDRGDYQTPRSQFSTENDEITEDKVPFCKSKTLRLRTID